MSPHYSRSDRELLELLWRAGYKVSAIAQRLGRSERSVKLKRMQLGLPPRSRRRADPPRAFSVSLGGSLAAEAKRLAARRGVDFSALIAGLLRKELRETGTREAAE